MVKKLIVFILLLNVFILKSQYTIHGKVFELGNKEPMPFVPVVIKGTNQIAQTDFDGNYSIKCTKLTDSIIATFVGFKRLAKGINKNATDQEINFPMDNEGNNVLDEVVVLAGDNPAHRIIRNTVKQKEKNNRNNITAYEYETYNKLEFDLTRIPKEMREKKIFKPISFVFDNVDSVNSGEKPSLPFFIIENLSQFYYKKNPTRKKEVIVASKVTGMENSSVSQVLGDM